MSPQNAKVVLFQGANKPLEMAEFPLPEELEPGAILVKTTLATVCGSDMHTWKGRRPFPTPAVLGHEAVGTVVKVGSGIDKDTAGKPISTGDRITWTIMASCGNCMFCRIRALPQKCTKLFKYGHVRSDIPPFFTGTFSEYVYLKPGTGIFKIPEDMEDEEVSPLMCAAATVTAGLDRIGMRVGDSVVVQGAGMLGLYATAIAKEQGAKQVIMLDVIDKRLETAKEFGADHILNVKEHSDEDLVKKIKGLTDGWGADIVVEVAGLPSVIPLGINLLRTGGSYLLQGSLYPNDKFTIDGHDIITKCLTIAGLHNYDAKHLGLALELAYKSRNKYPYKKLAGPEFPLTVEGVTAALQALERREAIRPIVTP